MCVYAHTTLRLEHAVKRFESADSVFELHVPEFELQAGQVCVVAGRSGCGKTTLLDALGCISPWQSCGVHLMCPRSRVVDVAALSSRGRAALRRREIGYVLQQGGLLPFLTAWENIVLALRFSGRMDRVAQARGLAEQLGVEAQLSHRPEALSIGQRQRVSIVRALSTCPALLLADEPTGALDPATAAEVRPLLLEAAKSQGSAVVIVTHDVELFAPAADKLMGFEIQRQDKRTSSTLQEKRIPGKEVAV